MNNIEDKLLICIYCGDVMNGLTKEQEKIFGPAICCDYKMLEIDGAKIHTIVRNIDSLKENIEKKVLEDIL